MSVTNLSVEENPFMRKRQQQKYYVMHVYQKSSTDLVVLTGLVRDIQDKTSTNIKMKLINGLKYYLEADLVKFVCHK